MKIGVVCEGPTDYPAIVHFFRHALLEQDIHADFRSLFPDMDKTRPTGGWANVLLWLRSNPPTSRIQRYFGGGLFGGALATEKLDAILVHLDADILPSASFAKFAKDNYNVDIIDVNDSADRGMLITSIIDIALGVDQMTVKDRAKHISAPAVESTETWCVAAFTMPPAEFETLRGAELTNAFMMALERSEGREPQDAYENVDKSLQRRQRFCQKHAGGSSRIVKECQHFARAIENLATLTK